MDNFNIETKTIEKSVKEILQYRKNNRLLSDIKGNFDVCS